MFNLVNKGRGYMMWQIVGQFSVGTTRKIERESDL